MIVEQTVPAQHERMKRTSGVLSVGCGGILAAKINRGAAEQQQGGSAGCGAHADPLH
jgi:hypothetical protein